MIGRLLSVNVGGPREVSWQGRTVRTAIWKQPVTGPRMVRRINIDGDDQGDRIAHGGEHRAVFASQIDSYRYWERKLGRDDFTCGQFGKNFSVEGLADDAVCISDRFRIGEAKRSPRSPTAPSSSRSLISTRCSTFLDTPAKRCGARSTSRR